MTKSAGLVIEPDGFADQHEGVIEKVTRWSKDSSLLEIHFEDGTEMLFPGSKETGGKWKYAKGLAPGMKVSAVWKDNPAYNELDPKSGPRAFFTLAYND